MSRAQGDGYRTWTDHKLNAYRARLDAKLKTLIDHKEKWYRFGKGWILAEERNRMENPNGSWKWNGWEIEAHEYWITVFPSECVKIENGKPRAIGCSVARKVIDDDKIAANGYFTQIAKPLAKELENWIPRKGDPAADNTPIFHCEGMKKRAVIAIDWEGDQEDFIFKLIIDGEEKMGIKNQRELKMEAERLGAELEETHTP